MLSWSSGKDSAWTLQEVRRAGEFEVVGLVTTLNEEADRVAMHGVRRSLLERQAQLAELPLHAVDLPAPCSNEQYQERLGGTLARLREEEGISHVIFGDLFLQDIRDWRIAQMRDLGLEAVFPLWRQDTADLARRMLDAGLEAWLSCVDTEQLDASFCGCAFDAALLEDLPAEVDPCGENGEFHTLVTAGPMFSGSLAVRAGVRHDDGRFVYTDFKPRGQGRRTG